MQTAQQERLRQRYDVIEASERMKGHLNNASLQLSTESRTFALFDNSAVMIHIFFVQRSRRKMRTIVPHVCRSKTMCAQSFFSIRSDCKTTKTKSPHPDLTALNNRQGAHPDHDSASYSAVVEFTKRRTFLSLYFQLASNIRPGWETTHDCVCVCVRTYVCVLLQVFFFFFLFRNKTRTGSRQRLQECVTSRVLLVYHLLFAT